MKKALFTFLLFGALVAAQAQTIQVSGDQTGVWDADTVFVVGDVMVMDSLRVLPGTVVLFEDFFGITVSKGATFAAQGTESDSIVFTVVDTTGFSRYFSAQGGWNGFHLYRSGIFLLEYCVLEYGKAFLNHDWFGGVLNIEGCDDVSILHCTLRSSAAHERGGALCAVDSRVRLQSCAINNNTVFNEENMYLYGGGACFLRCDVEMSEMEFRGNNAPTIGGALSIDSCSMVLDRSVFVDNVGVNGGGLYLMRSDKKCLMSNLLFDDNYSRHFGGGFALADVSPEIYNVLVTNNRSEGVSCNGVFFYGNSSPRITNSIVYGNYPPEGNAHTDSTQMWVWTFEDNAPEFRNCLIEGGMKYINASESITVFENVKDDDPLFVDAERHDFRLQEGSPCRDAGSMETPDYVTEGLDLGGGRRVSNGRIDIGPYEYSGTAVSQFPATPYARLVGNPLNANSFIEFDEAIKGEVSVSFYDLTGRCESSKLFDVEALRHLAIGDLSKGLAPGIYLIEVKSQQGICTLKAVR